MNSFFHKAPFIRIAVPFASGVAFGLWAQPDARQTALLFAGGVAAAALLIIFRKAWISYRLNPRFGLIAATSFFLIGAAWAGYRASNLHYDRHFQPQDALYTGHILREPLKKKKTYAVDIQLSGAFSEQGVPRAADAVVRAYAHPDLRPDTLRPGDLIFFGNQPVPHRNPPNPKQFDYGAYLRSQGILATVYLKEGCAFARGNGSFSGPTVFFETWRQRAIGLFAERGVSDRERGVIAALVLGKRDMVDAETRSAFTDAGAVHILAVSGLHVGIIYFFAAWIIGKVVRGRRLGWLRLAAALALLWLYAGIAGFSPSVLRAATMFSFIAAGREFGRFGNIFNMLAVSAFLLLMIDPFLIQSVGFMLSYLAVTGIVLIYPVLYPVWIAPHWVLDKIWSLTVVSVSAQAATLPVTLCFFHQFPNYFLFANLAVIPLATVLLYAGLAAIVLSPLPFLSDLVFKVAEYTAFLLNESVSLFGKLPHPVSEGLYITGPEAALMYVATAAAVLAVRDPRGGRLRTAQGVLLLLVLLFSGRKLKDAVRTEGYIFHVEGGTAVALFRGDHAVFSLSDSEMPDSEAFEFALSGFTSHKGMRTFRADSAVGVKKFSGSTVAFARNQAELNRALATECDFIIFSGRDFDPAKAEISRMKKGTAVVIDGSVPFYRRSDLAAALRNAGLSVVVTSESGAIRL